jgi:hypothetical protein
LQRHTLAPTRQHKQRWGSWGAAMIDTILAGAAGIIATPAVGGLAWRTAR